MDKIDSAGSLTAAIRLLELKQEYEARLLKEGFHRLYESVKPVNFIKNTIKEATESNEIKGNLLKTTVGLAAGYASKEIVKGITSKPIGKLLAPVIMYGMTNVVTKNQDTLGIIGKALIHTLTTPAKKPTPHRAAQRGRK